MAYFSGCCPSFNSSPAPSSCPCFNPHATPSYHAQCPGKLARFVTGHGDLSSEDGGRNNNCCPQPPQPRPQQCCPPPPQQQQQCCPPPPMKLRPSPRPQCCPPACIDTYNRPSQPQGRSPSERLRNVDVHEELCYYVPGENAENPDDYCCYAVCNCCGCPEQVPCPCPGRNGGGRAPPNPVKYNRRQRFTFQDDGKMEMNNFDKGPCWPFERPSNPGASNPGGASACCPTPPKNEDNHHRQRHNSGRSSDSNQSVRKLSPKNSRSRSDNDCKDLLPRRTGVYYFDSRRRTFIPEEELPQPPRILCPRPPSDYQERRRSDPERRRHQQRPPPPPQAPQGPTVQEFEIFEEERRGGGGGHGQKEPEVVIQPVIQPVIMPQCNDFCQQGQVCGPNPCCNPMMMCGMGGCNPMMMGGGCNPCCNPCNPMMNNLFGNSIMPMCIPMCAPPPPPPPPQQPMFPGSGGYYPQMSKKKKKKKRKSKSKKKKKSSKMEETIIDYVDRDSGAYYATLSSSTPSPLKDSSYPFTQSKDKTSDNLSPGGTGDYLTTPQQISPTNTTVGAALVGSNNSNKSNHSGGAGGVTSPGNLPGNSPGTSDYSRNIIVAGGPAELGGPLGSPPPGAYSQELDSQIQIAEAVGSQQPPVNVPGGQQSYPTASGVIMPAAAVEESSPNIFGGMGGMSKKPLPPPVRNTDI